MARKRSARSKATQSGFLDRPSLGGAEGTFSSKEFIEGVPLAERVNSPPQRTSGRFIFTSREIGRDAVRSLRAAVEKIAGKGETADGAAIMAAAALPRNASIELAELGIMIVGGDEDQLAAVAEVAAIADRDAPYVMEPEYLTYIATPEGFALSHDQSEWLRAYQAGMNAAFDAMLRGGAMTPADAWLNFGRNALRSDRASVSALSIQPGIAMTAVDRSPWTGSGIKVAVLDTGLDFTHPDFANRVDAARRVSYVASESPQDVNGHGTHCAGIACGILQPTNGSRYGVAGDAELYIGKVINKTGRDGVLGDVLKGVYWALKNGCRIVSVSIEFSPASGYSASMERAGAIAMSSGGMIVAAAGNGSDRGATPPIYAPVAAPANCPSILGIGAVDFSDRIARFSNRAKFQGGGVNFVAPGVDVLSSYVLRDGERYARKSGTSMSTPFVSGIAALYLQRDPGLSGLDLYEAMRRDAKQLGGASEDYGWGLIQAPR